MHITENCIVFFAADDFETSAKALGPVRALAAEKLKLIDDNIIAWAWIVDFPMYEKDSDSGKIDFGHNPFSMPQGGMEALNNSDPLDIIAEQYDAKFWDKMDRIVRRAVKNGALVNKRGTLKCVVPVYK